MRKSTLRNVVIHKLSIDRIVVEGINGNGRTQRLIILLERGDLACVARRIRHIRDGFAAAWRDLNQGLMGDEN